MVDAETKRKARELGVAGLAEDHVGNVGVRTAAH